MTWRSETFAPRGRGGTDVVIELTQANAIRMPLADESVQCAVTSPPYFGLRSYNLPPLVWGGREGCRHEWDNERLQREEGGWHRWEPNDGRKHNTVATRIDSDSRPSQGQFCRLCGAWKGNLGLEPQIDMYVQHLVEIFREVRRVLRKDGQLFLNISDSRTKDRQWYGIPHKLVFALQADGWRWEDEIIWKKVNCMPGSQTNRFTRSHEFVFMLNKSRDAFFDMDAVRKPHQGNSGWAKQRAKGVNTWKYNDTKERIRATGQTIESSTFGNPTGRNKRTVWTIPTKGYKGAHFAVFPEALVTPCIKAGTSEKGCCPKCGKGWVRVKKRRPHKPSSAPTSHRDVRIKYNKDSGFQDDPRIQGVPRDYNSITTTIGWYPACDCWKAACDERGMTYDENYEHFNHLSEWLPEHTPVPCIVLDPFCGSGTTLLAARRLGRSAVGLDLSFPYLHDQARTRLELDKLSAWKDGREPTEADWDDLPLFAQDE